MGWAVARNFLNFWFAIYEGLLARSDEESPKGAGQYFTPRELIKAVVDVMRPTPEETVCDPLCGGPHERPYVA